MLDCAAHNRVRSGSWTQQKECRLHCLRGANGKQNWGRTSSDSADAMMCAAHLCAAWLRCKIKKLGAALMSSLQGLLDADKLSSKRHYLIGLGRREDVRSRPACSLAALHEVLRALEAGGSWRCGLAVALLR